MKNKLYIEYLQQRLEELKASLPAHSIPAAMLIELEELEEELEKMLSDTTGEQDAAA
jgi:hypothetical protein